MFVGTSVDTFVERFVEAFSGLDAFFNCKIAIAAISKRSEIVRFEIEERSAKLQPNRF